MRYRSYREHKYVSAALNDVEREIARADFVQNGDVGEIKKSFLRLAQMLKAHAHFENERIHSLLRAKNSSCYQQLEAEHRQQDEELDAIADDFDSILKVVDDVQRIEMGYALYLRYRKFVAESLHHLNEEETILLPELQRLYSDDELRQVSAKAYGEMTPQHIIDMLAGLFPYMNVHDKQAFLDNIKKLVPEKFAAAWPEIRRM